MIIQITICNDIVWARLHEGEFANVIYLMIASVNIIEKKKNREKNEPLYLYVNANTNNMRPLRDGPLLAQQ